MPKVWIGKESLNEGLKYINKSTGPFISIGPTANWPAKVWPSNHFVLL